MFSSSFLSSVQNILSKLLICCITFLILRFPSISIAGAQSGLLLWYTQVLPVLLPFLIISSIIINKMHMPPVLTTIVLGFLCGYPLGAKNIHDYYIQGYFSKNLAQKLLLISSHASPMFLIGYVCTVKLNNKVPVMMLLFSIYWPPVVYGIFTFLTHLKRKNTQNDYCNIAPFHPGTASCKCTLDSSIEHSLTLICKIGCYIMIYSILCNFLITFAREIHHNPYIQNFIPIATGLLEMTTGIANVCSAGYPHSLTIAFVTAIAAFGGFSSISQINSTIKGTNLSLVPYVPIKLLFAILSGITIMLLL